MEIYSGKSVYGGFVVGPVAVVRKPEAWIRRETVTDPEAEVTRAAEAIEEAKAQLQILYDRAVAEVGEEGAAIFEAHRRLLDDPDYRGAIDAMIVGEGVSAAYAVSETGKSFSKMFSEMDDYLRARSADLLDVSRRVTDILTGQQDFSLDALPPSIVVADDLTPSETIQMDRKKILALVTVRGSAHSHTAILARMMNIPAVVGVPLNPEALQTGTTAVVDGGSGRVFIDPTRETLEWAAEMIAKERATRESLRELIGRKTMTRDHREVKLYANIGSVGDIPSVLENDAEGIGLFRSEFLYLGGSDFPSEEEQFQAYRQVISAMGGKKVIIRTLDIGADKQADYFNLDKEENPAMGCRAIRICLTRPDIFKTQLRAIFRAAACGQAAVMYPMIISVEEITAIQKIVAEVRRELTEEHIPFAVPEQGIMIETPAAVMVSDELAGMVDFFSIGTNDLTQYTLAIDRRNDHLDAFYNPHHPAVLRMIEMVVENAHRHHIRVGICGELAADLTLTEQFVEMGVDELSVPPAMILPIRRKVVGSG